MKHTKLLETNAAVKAELHKFSAVVHAASRVVEQSKEARRRRNNFALPQQDHDIERRRGHEADQEKQKAIYGNGETRCNGSSCDSSCVREHFNHFGSEFYD